MNLPKRNEEAERNFVTQLMESASQEECIAMIDAAIKERRPKLAGRIFALLKEPITMDENLRKAEQALAFFLIHQKEEQWSEVESFWEVYIRPRRSSRLRERHRPRSEFGTRSWKRR